MNSSRLWAIQLLTLMAITIWAATDPLFETVIRSCSLADRAPSVGWVRVVGLVVVSIVAVASLMALFAAAVGRRRVATGGRSIRQLLAITTVIALWCSLALHLDEIAWQGKRARFAYRVEQLETIAAPLRRDWPDRDGVLPQIGPFMAYPIGRPETLMLLHAPRVASQSVYVSAIERCTDGAIKLQLTGADGGDWAEWHPPHSRPSSFTGGLADQHELLAATALGGGWYLVRYNA